MNKIINAFWVFLLFFSISNSAVSQPTVTIEDYQRAAQFQMLMDKMVYQIKIKPDWLPDNAGFWYLHESRAGKTFMKVVFSSLDPKPVFDHRKLAKILFKKFKIKANEKNFPFDKITFLDLDTIEFDVNGDSYTLNLKKYKIAKKKASEKASLESKSPDGKWVAFSKSYNLYVRSVETGEEFQLSRDGKKDYEYANVYKWSDTIEGENGERPQELEVEWSPDSKRILTSLWDFRKADKMYLLDWSIEDRYRPKLLSYYRASPGDETILMQTPVIFDVVLRKKVITKLPEFTHINNPKLKWSSDGKFIYGHYWERGFKKLQGIMINPVDGSVKTVYTQKSKTNIDYKFFNSENVLNPDGTFAGQVLFTSEQSGWNQIYLADISSGKISTVTEGEFVVKKFLHLDHKKKVLYFTAAGKEAGNPYYNYVYRVGIDGGDLRLLTPENVHHDVYMVPNGEYFVDNYSSSDHATVSVLRKSEDGSIVLPLNKADAQALYSIGWKPPQIFSVTAKDGKTKIYGAIWKPTNFDPSKKYPIIDSSYTGPHTNRFPKDFYRALSNTRQALAELGFLVMVVDGLGTIGRSKTFHDWSYGKLAYALEDHVIAIKELSKRYSWVDISKVGIFGHSAGGYDAAQALLRFPDFYKVGVSLSANHDHRMEKAWWPEMYMGWPVGSHYHEQSNITMAGNLKGKLLISHGGIDENVNPSATFKLAEALINADKEFDMLIFPSARHIYSGKNREYFIKKRWNYFIEHLLGAKPIWSIEFP